MVLLVFAVILCLSSVLALRESNNALYRCGIRKRFGSQLIHHGRTAELGEWPWHAALYHRTSNASGPTSSVYKCGGTLIDQQHVLTAAHCVTRRNGQPLQVNSLVVHLGKHELYEFPDQVQTRNVSELHVHPEYSPNRNDFALLVLEEVVRYSEFVIPICLEPTPGGRADDLVGKRGWVAGWGLTENGTLAEELKTAQMPVVDSTECVRSDPGLYGRFISQGVYCASDRNGTSACLGDSGGGMYISVGDRWELRGIVSFSGLSATGSCDTRKYVVFTNVAFYYLWVKKLTDGRVEQYADVKKRISEKKCEEFKNLTRKRSNGVCLNARSPHTVSIVYKATDIVCSGVIVGEIFVLSSAVCGNAQWIPLKVQVESQESADIAQIIIHPNFERNRQMNNLMVIKLARPLELGSRLVPACLATKATENFYDTLMVNAYTGKHRRYYENAAMQAISVDECNQRRADRVAGSPLRRNISQVEVCVVAKHDVKIDGGDNLMLGMRGAGLQSVNTRSCVFTILGISNAEGDDLEVYTRVSAHLEWLEYVLWGFVEDVEEEESVATSTEPRTETTTAVTQKSHPYNRYSHDFYFPHDDN